MSDYTEEDLREVDEWLDTVSLQQPVDRNRLRVSLAAFRAEARRELEHQLKQARFAVVLAQERIAELEAKVQSERERAERIVEEERARWLSISGRDTRVYLCDKILRRLRERDK